MATEPAIPPDFPTIPFEAVQERVHTCLGNAFPEAQSLFAGAWNGLKYRYLACDEQARCLTDSLRSTETPYFQERDLFGFFVSGLATIESFCFGLYVLGAMIRPADFWILNEEDLKQITPSSTSHCFARCFPTQDVSKRLKRLVASSEFSEWGRIRTILTHRASQWRVICRVGQQHEDVEWAGRRLDQDVIQVRRQWLSVMMSELLDATDSFTAQLLPLPTAQVPASPLHH